MITMALPNKGRLSEPTLRLLADAGLDFEASNRVLSVKVHNADLELMFVRADDIPELVKDRVAQVGITGIDLLEEYGDGLPRLLNLGYGHCRLTAAVPQNSPMATLPDLKGKRIATTHPTTTGRFFERKNIGIKVVYLKGSVELAPKIGVADAIVDLVSTGSTLRLNGLRSIGTVLESQAVLVAEPGSVDHSTVEQVSTALGAVLAGRSKRYIRLNAPTEAVGLLSDLLPGLEAPTIVPLVEDGWVAIHSVVEATELWGLLPQLKTAGGKGILVSPIEMLVS